MESNLRPKARLLRTLGADLISSEKVALIELVKNSYDADASRVDITFDGPLKKNQGVIEILDDGHGMDANTIENTWLTIATNSKRSSRPKTSKGRPILGEKGIGRLAISRLGTVLEITTKTADANKEVFLTINWDDFNNDELYLDQVSVNWSEREPQVFKESSNKYSGTLLRIKNISKNYTEKDIGDIYNSLTRLISPKQNSIQKITDDDFSIFLNFKNVESGYDKYSGSVKSEFDTHDPHYRLTGVIDDDGNLVGEFAYLDRATKQLKKNDINGGIWITKERKPTCGDIYFDFKVWDRDNDSLRLLLDINRDEIEAKPQDIRDSLDTRAGISIYRDGFRVFPYGESGNDWLDLDNRRIQNPSQRISNNQILGSVFIDSQANPLLKDQSNREGILAGEAYTDFTTLLSGAINKLEVERSRVRAKNRKKETHTKLPKLFEDVDISNIISIVNSKYPRDEELKLLLNDKDTKIKNGINQTRIVLSSYSRLATLGSLVDRLVHEIRSALSGINSNSDFIEMDIEELCSESTINYIEIKNTIFPKVDKIKNNSSMIDSQIKHIEPFGGGRKKGRPKKVDVAPLIQNIIDIYSNDIKNNNITLIYDGQSNISSLDPGEFSSVIKNLLENAIYWSSHPDSHAPNNPTIEIEVARAPEGSLLVRVSDTGPGVNDEDKNRIFYPYETNKDGGTGLGLTIAGYIVEDIYKGELNLIQYGTLEGATFEAIFNKRAN
jgi:putative two-component sensor kinase